MTDLERKFLEASFNGDLKTVKKCIKQNVNIDVVSCINSTALIESSYNGHLDIVKYLVENGADINIRNVVSETALTISFYKESAKVVNYLLPLVHEYKQFERIYNDLKIEQKHIIFKHFLNNKEFLKQVNPLKMKGFTKDINEYIKKG